MPSIRCVRVTINGTWLPPTNSTRPARAAVFRDGVPCAAGMAQDMSSIGTPLPSQARGTAGAPTLVAIAFDFARPALAPESGVKGFDNKLRSKNGRARTRPYRFFVLCVAKGAFSCMSVCHRVPPRRSQTLSSSWRAPRLRWLGNAAPIWTRRHSAQA